MARNNKFGNLLICHFFENGNFSESTTISLESTNVFPFPTTSCYLQSVTSDAVLCVCVSLQGTSPTLRVVARKN